MLTDAFGCAQKENAAGVQGIMKQGKDLFLQDTVHVNHQVSATDQVQPRKGGIFYDILKGKNDHVAKLFVDLENPRFFYEKPV